MKTQAAVCVSTVAFGFCASTFLATPAEADTQCPYPGVGILNASVAVVSVAVFAISRLKSMGRIGTARAAVSAWDWPVRASLSALAALSALAVSVRVSVVCRAIGAAPTIPMHRHQIRQGRGKNIWRRWTPRISVKIIWNRLAFGARPHYRLRGFHRQGKRHRNQVKHRHRNQYPHRCRRSQCQSQQYR